MRLDLMTTGITKYAFTGEIAIGSDNELLVSTPLGSCIAIIAYDKKNKIGGIAHVMLPGKAPNNSKNENRYAENAFSNLFKQLTELDYKNKKFDLCLVGGANVLKKQQETICDDILESIKNIVSRNKINLVISKVGGYKRRSVSLDISTGIANYTVGDSSQKLLWNFLKNSNKIENQDKININSYLGE